MTYYRTQRADRDVADLLDPGWQFSHAYNGSAASTRAGVSTCATLEDLAEYLAAGQADGIAQPLRARPGEWVVVELDGDELGYGVDPGEILVRPTAIVSVTSADAELLDLIAEKETWLAAMCGGPDDDNDEEDGDW